MKITGYRSLVTVQRRGRPIGDANGVFASGVRPQPILLLDTDEGVSGIGVGSHQAIGQIYDVLDGADPRAVTGLYDRMLAATFKAGHTGSTFGTIGTIDTALWDLKAKLAGQPLWQLLGAADRAVPAYASGIDITLDLDQLHELYTRFAERGLATAKLKGGLDPDADITRLGVAAAALGRNARRPGLALDANECWSPKQAVRYVSLVEEHHDLAWVEEPVRRWDLAGLAAVSASVRAAVATGENLSGLEQFRDLIGRGAVDIVQTGSVWGITHFLRVAMVAHAFDRTVSPVGYHGTLAHAAAAVPNHLATEVQDLGDPVGITTDHRIEDGSVVLGDAPGLGIEVDIDALEPDPPEPADPPDATPARRPADAGLRLHVR